MVILCSCMSSVGPTQLKMRYHHTIFTVFSLDTKLHQNTLAYGEKNVCVDRRHTCTNTHTKYLPNIYFRQSKWIMQK